jgi:acetyl esterase/lipase
MMGSPYFYLEFLMCMMSELVKTGYGNPAVFALDYTLVPDAAFPKQMQEAVYAYEHVLSFARDPSLVCLSGDSAGACIALGMLLYLTRPDDEDAAWFPPRTARLKKPGQVALISPWVTLNSQHHHQTASDYLDKEKLEEYARRYAGEGYRGSEYRGAVLSPGSCFDPGWWRDAAPERGFFVTYGGEEVFEREISLWLDWLRRMGVPAEGDREEGGIHAWPVASLFLSSSRERRFKGLTSLAQAMSMTKPSASSP